MLLKGPEIAGLVARALSGETEAFSCLVEAHIDAAYATALAIVGRPSDAEDVAQDALLTAFERLTTCREPERFPGWLLRIVRNRALNWVGRRRLGEKSSADRETPTGEEQAPTADIGMRKQLLAALDELTPTQREVILLHELEEWTHAEIADALDVSEDMSRQHLVVARRKLRHELAGLELREVCHGT